MIQFDISGKSIFVAGHRGMVGSAVCRNLINRGIKPLTASRQDVDLTDFSAVVSWFEKHRPDVVIIGAAKVGGILANDSFPVDFLLTNLKIQNNVIEASFTSGVQKLLFLGSSCIYPKSSEQPIKEEYLLTGRLEPTNEWYALAKIAGLKLCQAFRLQHGCDFISAMPTNLYGPNDNFHPKHSHVPAALMRRFHEAKVKGLNKVEVWGTGTPRREFLHVDDLAAGCIHLLEHYSGSSPVNVGTGEDISISDFAALMKEVTGYKGEIVFSTDKPDGTMLKRLDISQITAMGWVPSISLLDGLNKTYQWATENGAFDCRTHAH